MCRLFRECIIVRRGNSANRGGVNGDMRWEWTLRQMLAAVRGIGIMLALFWVFIGIQFAAPLLRGGFQGMREHLDQVATAGVPPAQWPVAIAHMQEALAILGACMILIVLLQRYLARKVARRF